VSRCCEKLEAEAAAVREPRERGTFAIGSRYRATASEDVTADIIVCVCVCVCVCVIVNCKV
jgi:hypothetical protein